MTSTDILPLPWTRAGLLHAAIRASLLICIDRPFSATVITTVVCSRCSVLAVERWSKHDLWASAFAPWSQVSFAVPCICRGWNVVRRMWDSPECGVVKVSIRSRKLSGGRKRARLQCQPRIVDPSPKRETFGHAQVVQGRHFDEHALNLTLQVMNGCRWSCGRLSLTTWGTRLSASAGRLVNLVADHIEVPKRLSHLPHPHDTLCGS